MHKYIVENGKIISKDKIPCPPRWFADNRISFQVDEQGLGDIDYHNATSQGHYKSFLNSFWGGMRFFVNDGIHNYLLSFLECEILPFGVKGTCKAGDMFYELSIFAAEDTVFIDLKTDDIVPSKAVFRAQFYKTYCMVPQGYDSDLRYKSHIKRNWMDFELKNNHLQGGFTEEQSTTGICFGANFEMSFEKSMANTKYMIASSELQKNSDYVMTISFDTSEDKALIRCDNCINSYNAMFEKQSARYNNVAEKAPVLISPYESLNHFVALSPMYHESLKVIDVPGAIRAQTTHYWVWGWDSMTSNEATYYWGDKSFAASMLACFDKFSDEKGGIAHAFNRDMSCGDVAAPPAQGMYITLLYLHFCNGGSINELYPFAKRLFKKILDSEVNSSGLCGGTSLYPDFRSLINETGNDISAFNNTVSYCAIRAMEAMANAIGDIETAKIAFAFGERLRNNFVLKLFNDDIKFIDSSTDSITFEPRNVPSNNAVKWENNFCRELLDEVMKECLEFYENNLVSLGGLRPIPAWCEVYNRDANQLSCWWPVMVEFYSRLINQNDKTELIEQLVGWISHWTGKLMCPEGISCYADTAAPPLDNWNCMNGIWHAYSIRGWYTAIVHNIVGVDLDTGGLTVYPYSGKEMQLLGLHYGEKNFDIHMCGSGPFVDTLIVNKTSLIGTNKIPLDLLQDKNIVEVRRSATQIGFCNLKKAFGISLTDYIYIDDCMTCVLHGTAYSECVIYAAEPITVYLDDQCIDVLSNAENEYIIPVLFSAKKLSFKLICKQKQ